MIKKYEFCNLSADTVKLINNLIASCYEYEPVTFSSPDFENDDGTIYINYFSDNTDILSILICYNLGDSVEICGYTQPGKRNRGYFSELLMAAENDFGELPICVYIDGCSYDAFATLDSLGFEYTCTQHIMSLCNKPEAASVNDAVTVNEAGAKELSTLAEIHSKAFNIEISESEDFINNAYNNGDTIWCIKNKAIPVGLGITSSSSNETCLYALAVLPEYQKQGIASAALNKICSSKSILYPITLQVSEENTAAYSLYKKTGFISNEELMEYWG